MRAQWILQKGETRCLAALSESADLSYGACGSLGQLPALVVAACVGNEDIDLLNDKGWERSAQIRRSPEAPE
jgi:hypothetical protein